MHVQLCAPAVRDGAAESGKAVFRNLRLVMVAPVGKALRAEAGPQRVISSALQRKNIEHAEKQ